MLVLTTLLSHYRRHPVQALFLITGIAVANFLLVGTLLINAQARASYAEGSQMPGAGAGALITAADGSAHIDEAYYHDLRRQGFDQLAPILFWTVRTQTGSVLELVGIDVFAMPQHAGIQSGIPGITPSAQLNRASTEAFLSPPWQLWAVPARMAQLGLSAGESVQLADGVRLPPLAETTAPGLGHQLLLDIGALQHLGGVEGLLSGMMVFSGGSRAIAELETALPPQLSIEDSIAAPDPAELTESFHLNLSAMGLLAFVVGLFLTFNAVSFSYSDRGELIRRLKLCGVSRREIALGLITELSVFALAGLTLGYLGGAWLALKLLPGVGQTLASLYGVYISYPDSLIGSSLAVPVLMTMLACALCVAFPLQKGLRAPPIRRMEAPWQLETAEKRDRALLLAGLCLVALCGLIAMVATTLVPALLSMACLLLGAALCLPACIRGGLWLIGRFAKPESALFNWLLADTRWLLGPASLALMAMTLALISNSGLNTMIVSFRQATEQWLEQRLVAQLYLTTAVDEAALQQWLDLKVPGSNLAARFSRGILATDPGGAVVEVELSSLPPQAQFAASVELIRSSDNAQALFDSGAGVFISERAHRIDGWRIGDQVELCAGVSPQVVAIYRNYGNPQPQWLVSQSQFESCWPSQIPSGRAIVGPDDGNSGANWAEIEQQLARDLGLSDRQIIAAPRLKALGLAVFDRTFEITRALNVLTLLAAGIGIFCAVSAIHHHRRRNQALLACLGVSTAQRALLQGAQWSLLGVLSMGAVWPFGTALAWVLAQVVTPVAFGWSFPLRPDWQHYPDLVLIACASLLLAALIPGIRSLKLSTAELLQATPS